MDTNRKCKNSWGGGGNNAYKIFRSLVEEGCIPNTMSYLELFMTPMKMKNNFCNGHQYEMPESWNGGGNDANKVFMCQAEEENIIYKQNVLFGAVHSCNEKETIF